MIARFIITDIEIDMVHLVEGMRYYTTITACNMADLCISATSDGFVVDSTPPNAGVVIDGVLDKDVNYQASRFDSYNYVCLYL